MAKQREDRIGLLVIPQSRRRAGAAGSSQLVEVNTPPDQVIEIVDSAAAASRLVGERLDSLETDATVAGSTPHQPVERRSVTPQ